MNILVTGGAGHLGQEFVRTAGSAGHTIRVSSRRPAPPDAPAEWIQADLASGQGVVEAVSGVELILHAASDPRRSRSVDVEGTHRLLEAAHREGVNHLVFISIIGIDKIGLPYYRDKLAAEAAIRDSGVPYSILRTAQFHHFVDLLLTEAARVPLLLPVPSGFRVQSISTVEVAEALTRLIEDEPQGMVTDLAGPEAMTVRDAAALWSDVRGLRKLVVPFPVLGRVGASFRAGHNTTPDRPGGEQSWLEWLEAKYSSPAAAA